MLLAELKRGHALPSCFSSCCRWGPFSQSVYCHLFTDCAFCWRFCCLKWPLITVLKFCLVFLGAGGLWCTLWRKCRGLLWWFRGWDSTLSVLGMRVQSLVGKLRSRMPCLLLFICSVVSDSSWPSGQRHARLPCLSPSPWACSNSCPLNRWRHPSVSSSCHPLLLLPSVFPRIGVFEMWPWDEAKSKKRNM